MGDDKNLQQSRIEKLVGEITPHGRVEFEAEETRPDYFQHC